MNRWLKVSQTASTLVIVSLFCLLVSLAALFGAVAVHGQEGDPLPWLRAAAGLAATALWLFLIGQVMHIRAAVERLADKD
jgi:hypothetical protein